MLIISMSHTFFNVFMFYILLRSYVLTCYYHLNVFTSMTCPILITFLAEMKLSEVWPKTRLGSEKAGPIGLKCGPATLRWSRPGRILDSVLSVTGQTGQFTMRTRRMSIFCIPAGIGPAIVHRCPQLFASMDFTAELK